jgi:hypothetical protein
MLRNVKNAVMLFALLLLSVAGPSLAQPISTGPAQLALPRSGVNIDVPFTNDPICGFQIIVQGQKPSNFYLGTRNPWGNPTIVEQPPGSSIWVITYGSPFGPCYTRNNPIFWQNGKFLGAHFGFYTNDPLVNLLGSNGSAWATCWVFGLNKSFPGPKLTGHRVYNWGFDVINRNDTALAVQNAQLAVSPNQIPIDSLTRADLDALPWQPLAVSDSFVPAGSNEVPGTLGIYFPAGLFGQPGWGVVSYDLIDTATGELQSTVTFEFPLQ